MKFLPRQGEEQVEAMGNKQTKIKEVPLSTVASYAIH
jgi:hypothetical protein